LIVESNKNLFGNLEERIFLYWEVAKNEFPLFIKKTQMKEDLSALKLALSGLVSGFKRIGFEKISERLMLFGVVDYARIAKFFLHISNIENLSSEIYGNVGSI
jgi:hypothetical protein